MPSKLLNHLRVVVQVNAPEEDEYNNNNSNNNVGGSVKTCCSERRYSGGEITSSTSPPIPTSGGHMQANVLVINETTLQLNVRETEAGPQTNISHKMSFDQVSFTSVDVVREELHQAVGELILERQNICIMRFAAKHEIEVAIFFDTLIMFVEKRLQQEKYKLQYCKLEGNDISTMLPGKSAMPSEQGFSIRGTNLIGPMDSYVGGSKCLRNTKNQFRNTHELLLWLLNEYRSKLNEITGHEKLVFNFSITNGKHQTFQVKLYLFNIYLNMMSIEDREHWHKYMQHVGEGCQGGDCEFMHNGLTLSISPHIDAEASKNSLLLFEVPTDLKMAHETVDMLQLAYAVVRSRKNAQTNMRRKSSIGSSSNSTPSVENYKVDNEDFWIKARLPNKRVRPSIAFTVPIEEDDDDGDYEDDDDDDDDDVDEEMHLSQSVDFSATSSPKKVNDDSYSQSDFSSLSEWYRKIDGHFNDACKLQNEYYLSYFIKISFVCANILLTTAKYVEKLESANEDVWNNISFKDQSQIMKYNNYQKAKAKFEQLTEDIENTLYKDTLNTYLKTKTYELNIQGKDLKVKYLENLRQKFNQSYEQAMTIFNNDS
uniref:Uncharacterized protein n=1 Tax=Glossina morsitans morsitans TaxID=37546 RepID=A0A1B0G9A8_GLOMM